MSGPIIGNISDTARWVAIYRAMETERPDALFKDPYARRLAGPRGEAIVKGIPGGARMSWPMVVRTTVMDEIILRVVKSEGVDGVLNLAAGLDARPWRLKLPAELQWIDVDHPEMIDLKTMELREVPTSCRYEGIRLDLSRRDERQVLFRRVGERCRKVLVISEGLLVYLTPEQVADLATDLHAEAAFRMWLIDLASPGLLKYLEKGMGKTLREGNAPFRFGPAESTEFFAPYGWRELEWRSQFHEGLRLNRTFRGARVWHFIAKLMGKKKQAEMLRFSGIALLERAERPAE